MLVYEISTGKLYRNDLAVGLVLVAQGHSGFEDAMDDPKRQGEKHIGPLPAGAYAIGEPYDDPGHLGVFVMRLVPTLGTDVLGRDGNTFRVHGMSKLGARESSHGCLIFDRTDRSIISTHKLLVVVSRLPAQQLMAA